MATKGELTTNHILEMLENVGLDKIRTWERQGEPLEEAWTFFIGCLPAAEQAEGLAVIKKFLAQETAYDQEAN
jgi:pyruvate formate-lyase activating enzyme-like uncharacterized protein